MLKEKYCEEVKVINILGYELEVINILDFKLFYDSCTSFNSFSKKAFLKAVKIPPQYFLEQPEDTQEDLLLNKLDFIPSSKLHGHYLAILKKDNNVLNCVRVDKNELENLDERISRYHEFELPLQDSLRFVYRYITHLFIFHLQFSKMGLFNKITH